MHSIAIREDGMWEVKTGTTPCIITDFLDTSGVSLVVSDAVDISSPETVFVYSSGEWSIAAVTQCDHSPGDHGRLPHRPCGGADRAGKQHRDVHGAG